VIHRLGAAPLLFAVATAAVTFGGAPPASAEGTTSASRYVVVDVAPSAVDDLVAVQPGTTRSGGWIPALPSNIASNLCAVFPDLFDCICVGVSPDLCKNQ
jgi:hypothetical protein